MHTFGLLGFPVSHSFSENYFSEKFRKEGISDAQYKAFPFPNLKEFPEFIKKNPGINGLNVTIPYKEKIITYLDDLDETAESIGAVNTIRITRTPSGNKILKGYNTDAEGFEISLKSFLGRKKPKTLILGSGGSSKAVQFVLAKLKIPFSIVSRNSKLKTQNSPEGMPSAKLISYEDLDEKSLKERMLIINTTPLGMFPAIESCPSIPYSAIGPDHFLFDLVYNPEETLFLKTGKEQGAKTRNGLEMLHVQAEKSWEIWNKK